MLATVGDSITLLYPKTDSYSPFGLPTSFILSKEVLTGNQDGSYRIYQIPEYNAEDCVIVDSIAVEIVGNSIVGKGTKMIESFEYSEFQNYYNASRSETKKFLETYLELGLQNFELVDWKITPLVPRSKLRIDYQFSVARSVLNYKLSQFINLNLTRPFSNQRLETDRRQSYEIAFKRKYVSHISVKIPKSKKVGALPENINSKFNVGTVNCSYKQEGDQIILDRTITIDRLLINQDEFSEWNNFINELLKVYDNGIEFN